MQEWVQPGPTESPADPSSTAGGTPTTTGSAPGGAAGTSGSAGGASTTPPAQRIDETPAAATEPRLDETAAIASSTSGDNPAAEQAPLPRAAAGVAATGVAAAVTPSKPAAAAQAASTPAGQAGTLEGLLSDVRQELRSAQGQIDDLRRHLDDGAPPPPDRLTSLRTTLVRIAPMLVALEVGLHAAGRLTPHLRHLLHRVRSDLRGVRVTAHGLVTALRRSGARGAELRLLLGELKHFAAISSALASTPGVRLVSAPPVQGATPAYSQQQPVPVAGPPSAIAPPAERQAPDRPPPAPRDPPGDEEPPPWSSAPSPGSATASPGGAFFFAGVASLTMLLIGLGLPALRARLEVPPGRRYTAAFLAPLERPG